jgi:hypothetical protein
LSLELEQGGDISANLFTQEGRNLGQVLPPTRLQAGSHQLPLHLRPRPKSGYYLLKIKGPGGSATVPLLLTD